MQWILLMLCCVCKLPNVQVQMQSVHASYRYIRVLDTVVGLDGDVVRGVASYNHAGQPNRSIMQRGIDFMRLARWQSVQC